MNKKKHIIGNATEISIPVCWCGIVHLINPDKQITNHIPFTNKFTIGDPNE